MGFLGSLLGSDAKDAANAAAADTYKKQQAAIGDVKAYGDTYANKFSDLAQPYNTNGALQRLMSDPSSVRSLPGYQFAQDEGTRAIDHSAAARGMDQSGRTLKDLSRFSTGLADQTYGNQLNRLMQSQNAYTGTVGQGLQGQLGTQTAAFNGGMNASQTVGQGMVAGANAEAAGAQNLLNFGGYLGGKFLGGGFGGGGNGGSSYNPARAGALY